MTALLAIVTVLAFGTWIPLAQVMANVPQRLRTFYVTAGNFAFATVAFVIGGSHMSFGWREFWLPFVGGLVWTEGNYSAFRASEDIGLARAAGSWTALNIIVAFGWGALLFGELDGFTKTRFSVLAFGLLLVLVGVFLVVGATSDPAGRATAPSSSGHDLVGTAPVVACGGSSLDRRGLLWAASAGVLWGSYFIPAEWAKVPSTVSNFPLALGMLVAGAMLALRGGTPSGLDMKATGVQLVSGVLFGIGDLTLLGLVKRVGAGTGFTIAQLSLLVNASIGIWIFKVPRPGSRAARVAIAGILLAGTGGGVIGAMR
jgi:glucose uptake protein